MDLGSVRPDLAIFCTLVNHSKLVATIILPKLTTLSGNFCKGVKIIHFSSEIIYGQLLQTFGDFYLVTLNRMFNQRTLTIRGRTVLQVFDLTRQDFTKQENMMLFVCSEAVESNTNQRGLQVEHCKLLKQLNPNLYNWRPAIQ